MSLLLVVLLLFHRLREKRNGKKRCKTREKPRQPIRLPRRPNPATTEEALRCRLGSGPRPRDARHPHHHMVARVANYFIFRCCRHGCRRRSYCLPVAPKNRRLRPWKQICTPMEKTKKLRTMKHLHAGITHTSGCKKKCHTSRQRCAPILHRCAWACLDEHQYCTDMRRVRNGYICGVEEQEEEQM